MAKERKASVIYEGNASQLVYAFPFDYLRKKFVKVEDIYTNITELTIGVDYTVEDKQVRLVKGIPVGHFVKIYRKTTTDPLVEWQDASVLRSDDLSLQEVQLLHLAEEALDMAQDKGLTTDDNDGVWDARYNKIKNLLEPTEAGDAVNLGYITKNQDSLLNKLNSTGATQNKSIVATGDAQNARLIATGEAQNTRLLATGDNKNKTLEDTGDAQNERLIATGNEQNTRLTVTGTYQNKLVTDTGKSYVSTMTTLKDTVVNKANEVNSSADLAKKWAMSDTSPDGNEDSKSAKTWAASAKTSETHAYTSEKNAGMYADRANTYLKQATNRADFAETKATAAENSATAAAKSAEAAAKSEANLGTHEANAAASAAAAAKSAENAKLWDPTGYAKLIDVFPITDTGRKNIKGTITDLNDIKCLSSPSWSCLDSSYVRTMSNCPTQTAFYLFNVRNGASTTSSGGTFTNLTSYYYYIIQVLIDISGVMWVRPCFNSAKNTFNFSAWQKVAAENNVATKAYVDALKPSMLIDNNSLFNHLHRLGANLAIPDGNIENFELGIFSSRYDTANVFANQPTTYGQLINIPAYRYWATQLWVDYSGKMFYRGAAATENINEKSFTRYLDETDNRNILNAIPKKLSQLSNDANYATTTDVATAVEKSATTIKAQIPKATSQLTNDSGYATTESVDNKIGAIWDEPLDWDTIESTTIMDGTAIIYNNSNIPARFRLQLLYDIFKRDTDTQLDNYVLKTDYSQEAQKWKDAYNNLRKRSTPTAFDDDELTVLMNTPIGKGTITLSQPYTDFDGLLIDFSDDEGALLNSKYISTAELNRRIARAKDIGIFSIFLLSEYYYWSIWITERSGFSTTTFPNRGENCQIKCIYGVKLKEIT